MRLIDANSIKFRPYYDDYVDYDGYINDLKTWQLDDILSDRVDNAPTVKAIPVEWILDWLLKYEADYKTRKDVTRMLNDWRKENEIDRFR